MCYFVWRFGPDGQIIEARACDVLNIDEWYRTYPHGSTQSCLQEIAHRERVLSENPVRHSRKIIEMVMEMVIRL